MKTLIEITGPSYASVAAVAICGLLTDEGSRTDDLRTDYAMRHSPLFFELLADYIDEGEVGGHGLIKEAEILIRDIDVLRERLVTYIAQEIGARESRGDE